MSTIPAIIMLAAIVLLGWLLLGTDPAPEANPTGENDQDELLDAEQEVRELDAWVDPDDADDHIPDWGPGVPRP